MEFKTALKHIACYVSLAALFGLGIYHFQGNNATAQFAMTYLIEICLSMDNLFVFALIFTHFQVPKEYQYRVLYWGIIGAVVFRLTFIAGGVALINHFEWLIYLFGAFLIWTGLKMLFEADEEPSLEDNKIMKWCHKHLDVTKNYVGNKFWFREVDNDPYYGTLTSKTLWFTPLFVALVVVEISDIIFALDSIPAAFAISRDPFIIFSANIFAILGLRSMYFVLAEMLNRFEYLKYGLSLILVLIGTKMVANHFLGTELISTPTSLIATVAILAASTIYSILKTKGVKNG